MKNLFLLYICSLFATTSCAQLPKEKVIANINTWYEQNPDKYTISIKGKKASANITRYHPERQDEENDLIEVAYEGMKIQLKFDKPIQDITTHPDSLQKYFSYVSLTNIYNKIPAKGWEIYPRTGQSVMRGKGVKFTSGGESLSLTLNWSTYTVMGYKKTAACDEERSIEDGSVSDACLVYVRKNLPLEVVLVEVPLSQH